MTRIATFVFFDTETTGLPSQENNRTKITELCMIAVKRDHILEQGDLLKSSQSGPVCPRVINKLNLCLNPRKLVSDGSSIITGLTNELLEDQISFNQQVFQILDNFLNVLEKPVCLVAHNGHGFDFPILKQHLEKLNVEFSNDVFCADSLYAIYDICESKKAYKRELEDQSSKQDFLDTHMQLTMMQAENETTPRKRKVTNMERSAKKRRIFFEGNPKPKLSYNVVDVHERLVRDQVSGGASPDAHRAEGDCVMLLEIAVMMGTELIQWFDKNCCLFSDIKPMTPGVRLGD